MAKSKIGRSKKKGYVSKGKRSNVTAGLQHSVDVSQRIVNKMNARLAGKDTVEVVATGNPARPFERRRVSGKAFLEHRKANEYRMKGGD